MYEISKEFARKIVYELKTHINANFNFMDKSGVIIASVDPTRIGGLHLGAKQIIDKSLEMFYISAEMENENTKEGINLALKVFGEIVGVVGITGKKDKVMPYATIVKKMTEIMIEGSIIKEDSRLKRHIKYRYIEDLLANPALSKNHDFITRGIEIGIDIRLKRRAVVFSLKNYADLIVSIEGQRIIDSIDDIVREFADYNTKILYLYLPSHYTFFYNVDDFRFENKLYKLGNKINQMFNQRLIFGIGDIISDKISYRNSYTQALRAKELAVKIGKSIVYYDELQLENYLLDIDMDKMNSFINAFSEKIPRSDLLLYIQIIDAYFESDGSIKLIAKNFYLHKNTIQYRLQKMFEFTGFDIRKPSHAIYYYFFLEFYRILYGVER
ncbi:CdaR family transcriptional regulator [Helcococcus ovis]|uniref:CdaR family transcriptional regulator n=1 Tax=Helcococcus ovis TaxID=72026 RepID=UPI001431ACA6|nr:sugar diacid recognition domain-containing protein [Helcococcus ovis]WNZ01206.1 sugar diacid recognition domain-containing protein [Helcococcus ovis]